MSMHACMHRKHHVRACTCMHAHRYPTLSPSAIGRQERLQPVLPSAVDASRAPTLFAAGAALLSPPLGTHLLQLHVAFRLVADLPNLDTGMPHLGGDGTASGEKTAGRGEGVALSYGSALPLHELGELGGGNGLRVQFLSRGRTTVPQIIAMYDGEVRSSKRAVTACMHARACTCMRTYAQAVAVRDGEVLGSAQYPHPICTCMHTCRCSGARRAWPQPSPSPTPTPSPRCSGLLCALACAPAA